MSNNSPVQLPLPIPAEVELVDLPHMPLFDKRLMSSRTWLDARHWRGAGPGLGFCAINLWVEAFRSVPAGSLDDDDDVLADKARCDIDYWFIIKEKALRGWVRHSNRIWHPVIADIAWNLWLGRLSARHAKALDSHRAAAKRAMDKGCEPPDPPGGLQAWIRSKYPATAAFQTALVANESMISTGVRTSDNPGNTSDNEPKRSEGKDYTPLSPQPCRLDLTRVGKEKLKTADRKLWFAHEKERLQNEFGPMLPVVLTYLQRPGVTGAFGLVQAFKGCWIARSANGGAEIVTPSKQRADAIKVNHGEWLWHYWPDLTVRHARVDELRAAAAAKLTQGD